MNCSEGILVLFTVAGNVKAESTLLRLAG